MEEWAKLSGASDIRVLFSGPGNFRKVIYPQYKANRVKRDKPLAYVETVRALKQQFRCDEMNGLEADDLMGILATTPRYRDGIIVTLDKDLRTVPGKHLNPLKEDAPVSVSQADAHKHWFRQVLTGDSVDNFPGCPGIGPVKADKILSEWSGQYLHEGWALVKAAYRDKQLPESNALLQAQLAKILTRSDYDKKLKEVVLWTPHGQPKRLKLNGHAFS